MGRIVRRFGRFHQLEVTDALYQYRQILAAIAENSHGMRVRHAVDNVVQTGFSYLMHLEQEILQAAGEITGELNAIRIEQYTEAGTVIGGDLRAIHVVNQIAVAPAGQYELMRLSKHGPALCDAGIRLECGAAGDMTYAFWFQGAAVAAWDPATTPPGAIVGRVAVMVHGVPLYIALHN